MYAFSKYAIALSVSLLLSNNRPRSDKRKDFLLDHLSDKETYTFSQRRDSPSQDMTLPDAMAVQTAIQPNAAVTPVDLMTEHASLSDR